MSDDPAIEIARTLVEAGARAIVAGDDVLLRSFGGKFLRMHGTASFNPLRIGANARTIAHLILGKHHGATHYIGHRASCGLGADHGHDRPDPYGSPGSRYAGSLRADVVAVVQPEGVQRALLEAQAMTLTAGELRESMGLRGRDWIPRHFNAEMPTRSPSRPCALCESSRRARPKMMKNSNSVGNLPARIAEPR